jgi:rhomboid-like protein
MTRNFLINEANIQAGRIWTFVTSCFSHSSGTHIFVNCLGLYFMAPAAAQYVSLFSSTYVDVMLIGR